jgi:hypothetical protein
MVNYEPQSNCQYHLSSEDKTIQLRRIWRYQRSNQNPYIEEEQTTQWPKEKVQNDKQRSTKHTHKTNDRVTRTPLKTGGDLGCSGRVCSSYSINDTRRVNLVTNMTCALFWLKVIRHYQNCPSFFDWWRLITSLVSSNFL